MTTRLDVWCSRVPYVDHAAPVFLALPEERRGRFMVAERLIEHARLRGIIRAVPLDAAASTDPLLVLSRCEIGDVPPARRLVFLEHGVGASYDGQSHLKRWPQVELVLTTPANAEAHRPVFGECVVEVGCPKLDGIARRRRRSRGSRRVVAISHHWDQQTYPETRSAWPWDQRAIERLVASGEYEVIGHKHPGDVRPIEKWWRSLGAEFVADWAEVLERADVYVADNTSTLYEFAATDRPVVVLSPPFYRREVTHGLRFWRHIPGIECSQLDQLEACIAEAFADVPERARARQRAVEAAYGPMDRHATERAVAAIVSFLETVESGDTETMLVSGPDVSRRDQEMGETIVTTKRLYRTDPKTGYERLAYPIGAEVPVEEYRELVGHLPAPTPVEKPVPAKAAATAPRRKDVVDRLKELRVEFNGNSKTKVLVSLLAAAEAEEAKRVAAEAAALRAADEGDAKGPADSE